jgi:catechol 2,3-dioxygenase-like lactoylglutathione lyase family enzyme
MNDVDTTQPATGFDHLTIIVANVDEATRAYEGLLGSKPSWRGDHPELGTRASLFGLRNTVIELVGPLPDAIESEGMRQLLETRGEGLYTLAFETEDAQQTSTNLRARGIRAAPPADGEARGVDGSLRHYRTVELSPRSTRGLNVLAVQRADAAALRMQTLPAADCADALDHAVIRTAAPDAAVALYGQAFGLRLALDRELFGTRMLFFRAGGVTLEVVHDASLGEIDAFYGLTYRVRDIEEAHRRIAAHGFAVSVVRTGHKPGTQVFSVKDGTCGVPTLILRDPARD